MNSLGVRLVRLVRGVSGVLGWSSIDDFEDCFVLVMDVVVCVVGGLIAAEEESVGVVLLVLVEDEGGWLIEVWAASAPSFPRKRRCIRERLYQAFGTSRISLRRRMS